MRLKRKLVRIIDNRSLLSAVQLATERLGKNIYFLVYFKSEIKEN